MGVRRFTAREVSAYFRRLAPAVEEGAATIVARAAFRGAVTAVFNTPIGFTATTVANWFTSVGSPDIRVVPAPVKGNAQASIGVSIARAEAAIVGYRIGDGPIFVANSTPQILPIDRGRSRQAPQGVSRPALAAARAEYRRGGLLANAPR